MFSWNFYRGAALARNDMMPLLFSLIAVYLMLWPSQTLSSKYLALGLSGLLVALAVGTKLNYVHMPIAGLLFLVMWPRELTIVDTCSATVVAHPSLIGLLTFLPIIVVL